MELAIFKEVVYPFDEEAWRADFEKLVDEIFVPDSVEGLGYVEKDSKDTFLHC